MRNLALGIEFRQYRARVRVESRLREDGEHSRCTSGRAHEAAGHFSSPASVNASQEVHIKWFLFWLGASPTSFPGSIGEALRSPLQRFPLPCPANSLSDALAARCTASPMAARGIAEKDDHESEIEPTVVGFGAMLKR